MSNHSGIYMLRDMLDVLNKAGVWAHMPRADVQKVIINIVHLARTGYDCNPGEILEDHEAFGVCHYCLKPAERLRYGMCPICNDDEDEDEDDEDAS
ncbi:hypothetical protein [Candidatus Viridilinea mediisalina]|uniref:Uncharacterized protein n=1 Tax=Candidatus Viridilinea mediisalina TaxID=2024553 RepID=A0A2A6RDV3_9CHLR|nr:hypothetical protein [Candidatus Viridilinea mediisalina]PDW00052.1 hypothetical protein CJ255_21170 [Candidatus Viridilinea mediisalina]